MGLKSLRFRQLSGNKRLSEAVISWKNYTGNFTYFNAKENRETILKFFTVNDKVSALGEYWKCSNFCTPIFRNILPFTIYMREREKYIFYKLFEFYIKTLKKILKQNKTSAVQHRHASSDIRINLVSKINFLCSLTWYCF